MSKNKDWFWPLSLGIGALVVAGGEQMPGAALDAEAHRLTDAERAFLATLGGDCDLPAASHAVSTGADGEIWLRSLLAAEDGTVVLRDDRRGADPAALGAAAAVALLDSAGRALLGR